MTYYYLKNQLKKKEKKLKKREIIERSVKQLNTYGNGIGVLVTREAKAIGLKSGSRVQVSAVRSEKKDYIVIEKFPLEE